MNEESKLIQLISQASSDDGDLLLDFMNEYGLDGLNEATTEQLQQFIADNRLGGGCNSMAEPKKECILYSSPLNGVEGCMGLKALYCKREACKFYKSSKEYTEDGRRKAV